jgi:hypothetical protein
MTSNKIQTVLALAALTITGFAFNVAAEDIPALLPDPDGKADNTTKPLKVYILVDLI